MIIKKNKRLQVLMGSLAIAQGLAMAPTTQAQEQVGAGDFSLTGTPSVLPFPLSFERPTGEDMASIANAVIGLGPESKVYQDFASKVPEALEGLKADGNDDPALVVRVIQWYNSLGGTPVTTVSGEQYTTSNLTEPANQMMVIITDGGPSTNAEVTRKLKEQLDPIDTVGALMDLADSIDPSASIAYRETFDAYAQIAYTPGKSQEELMDQTVITPVIEGYRDMITAITPALRDRAIEGADITEVTIATFYHPVLTGRIPGISSIKTTKFTDMAGNEIQESVKGDVFTDRQEIEGYVLVESRIDGDTKTFIYRELEGNNKTTEVETTEAETTETETTEAETTEAETTEAETTEAETTETETTEAETTETETTEAETTATEAETTETETTIAVGDTAVDKDVLDTLVPTTYWVDLSGKMIKKSEKGKAVLDAKNFDGYLHVKSHTMTSADINGAFAGSIFKVGDVLNVYRKDDTKQETSEETKEPQTQFVDQNGVTIKDPIAGANPDRKGEMVPGYTIVTVETRADGSVVNVYIPTGESGTNNTTEKDKEPTEEDKTTTVEQADTTTGEENSSQETTAINGETTTNSESSSATTEEATGLPPRKDGSSGGGSNNSGGYSDQKNNNQTIGNTKWLDESGKALREDAQGHHPDNEGDDIPGYKRVDTYTDVNNNTINVYRMSENALITHYVTEDGYRLADDTVSDRFGEQLNIRGYVLKDVRMSKDGREKFYVYEPGKNDTGQEPASRTKDGKLPQTGEQATRVWTVTGLFALATGGLLFWKSKKDKNESEEDEVSEDITEDDEE